MIKKLSFPKDSDPRLIGSYFEEYTKSVLIKKGFGFLAHSFKAHPYEIDLIMTDNTDIVFVEVKARLNSGDVKPELAVDRTKMKNIFFAAARFISQMEELGIDPAAFGYRFDMAAIEHGKDGDVTSFRYHKNYYETNEAELLRYAKRYGYASQNKIER